MLVNFTHLERLNEVVFVALSEVGVSFRLVFNEFPTNRHEAVRHCRSSCVRSILEILKVVLVNVT